MPRCLRDAFRLSLPRLPEDGDCVGPVHLLHAERLEILQDRRRLVLVGRDLHDQALLAHRDDPAAEEVNRPENLLPVLRREAEADEHQLALDRRGAGQTGHRDHIDKLVQLLLDLFREIALRPAGQRDPGDLRVRRLGDAEAPDVVAPAKTPLL